MAGFLSFLTQTPQRIILFSSAPRGWGEKVLEDGKAGYSTVRCPVEIFGGTGENKWFGGFSLSDFRGKI